MGAMGTYDRNDDLLERVLGPQGPELTCEACFEQLDVRAQCGAAGA
jgi:hypothetical protein